jgi:hypothetical protein
MVGCLFAGECITSAFARHPHPIHPPDKILNQWNNPEIWCAILDGSLAGELCGQMEFIVEELKRVGIIGKD